MDDLALNNKLNNSIIKMLKNALHFSIKKPGRFLFLLKTLRCQKIAAAKRNKYQQQNVHVPVFMIASVTSRCNLNCKGCYAMANKKKNQTELTADEYINIFKQARELGTSFILLAGGEPLSRKDIFKITKEFPDIVFPLFTNGQLINEEITANFLKQKNMLPVLSIEGYEKETDDRRGKGVYKKLNEVMSGFKRKGVFFGASITLTSANFENIMQGTFIKDLVDAGCGFLFLVEYVPVKEGTNNLVLNDIQKQNLPKIMHSLRQKYSCIFFAFPGDEDALGGCLAAGRGFVHINPAGELEPCPFAPYSDMNLKNTPLKDALKSELFNKIRTNHSLIGEGHGGCALWENRNWVKSQLIKSNNDK